MAYAYLFKYIIIGDTGEGPGPPGQVSAACTPGLRSERGLARAPAPTPRGASLRAGPGRSISAVQELVTWALRAAAAWPPVPGPRPAGPAAGAAAADYGAGSGKCVTGGACSPGPAGPGSQDCNPSPGLLTLGPLRRPRERKGGGPGEQKVMDGRKVLGFLNGPTFSDLHASA